MAKVKRVKAWVVVDKNAIITNWYQFYCVFQKKHHADKYKCHLYKIIPVWITPRVKNARSQQRCRRGKG